MNKTIRFLLLGFLIVAVAIGGYVFLTENGVGNVSQESGSYQSARKQETTELSDGQTYDLTAEIVNSEINGVKQKMFAYNGSIPGPLIKVKQGSEVTINFKNNTDIDTTLHSHGVRMDNKFDGVPDVTQDPIKPGGSFTYKLKFPDAGIFWYHPHIREDYAQELGLYGNFLVTPSDPNYYSKVDREETLFLDDILMEDGKIANFDQKVVDHTLMGRFGNTMLVNGQTNYQLAVKQGEKVRFYITNAANTRTFNFKIPGASMKLIGSDNGKYQEENIIDSVIIGPSERQIIEAAFDQSGAFDITSETPEKTYALGKITVEPNEASNNSPLAASTNQDITNLITTFKSQFDKPADKNLKLTLQMGQMGGQMGGHMMMGGQMMQNEEMSMGEPQKIEWEDDMNMMNRQSTQNSLKWKMIDEQTNEENMNIKWQFKKGDVVKIKIFNDDKSQHPMQHPIHIHGQRFLVTKTNGIPNNNLVFKDTTLVQTGDTVELVVPMDNPGDWAIHCHIPEHMEAGMMSKFTVT